MNNKKTFWNKALGWYFRVGQLDEYKINELNKIFSHAFLILFSYFMLITLGMTFTIPLFKFENVLFTILIANFIFLFIIIIYVSQAIKNKKLDITEAYDQNDYEKQIHKAKRNAVKYALIFFIVERLVQIILDVETDNISFMNTLLNIKDNFTTLIMTIVFGFAIYFQIKRKIKKD